MPFSETSSCTEAQWTEIFEDIFRPAFTDLGYPCERAKPTIGNLTGSIVHQLRTSRIVLADLTDRNPNVFYELGVRHALGLGTIIVAQGEKHVPSDLRGYWFLSYGIRPAEVRIFKNNIARLVREIEAAPDQSDNPVADYLQKEHAVVSEYAQRENLKKLSALCTEITGNVADLRSRIEYISYGCLELLLQTRYIDPGPEILKEAYELWHILQTIGSQSRDTTGEFIETTISRLQLFHAAITAIIGSIGSGEFEEPEKVSTMVWAAHMPSQLIKPASESKEVAGMPNFRCYFSLNLSDQSKGWPPLLFQRPAYFVHRNPRARKATNRSFVHPARRHSGEHVRPRFRHIHDRPNILISSSSF